MKHGLIKPNYILLNSLDLFDSPIRDDELYTEMDDEFNVPVQFKGTTCIFSSRMPSRAELDTCRKFDTTSHNEWNL